MSYNIKPDLKYLPEHDWARIEGDIVAIGVTDFAQKALKDVVYVELPEVGTTFGFKEVFGTIESVKAASELFCPVAGEVVDVNMGVNDEPEKVNSNPYESWLIKVKPSNLEADWEKLMTPEEYTIYCSEEVSE